MTVASRGRSMKMAENIDHSPASSGGAGLAITLAPGRRLSMPCDDHLFAALQPVVDDRIGAGLTAQLHPRDDGFAVRNVKT